MHILLVKDDVRLAESLTEILVAQRYQVDCARDGEVGWRQVSEATYDLVLLDILSGVNLNRRSTLILVASLGLGMGVSFVPDALANTPYLIRGVFSSGIATGGTMALLLNRIVPGPRR